MSIFLQQKKDFPVQIGTVVIYLSDYQIAQSSSLKETGTAEGKTALTGCWKMGTRIKLTGQLAPDLSGAVSVEQVIGILAEQMLLPQTLILGKLSYPDAILCGYTVAEKPEQSQAVSLSLLFYTGAQVEQIEEQTEEQILEDTNLESGEADV